MLLTLLKERICFPFVKLYSSVLFPFCEFCSHLVLKTPQIAFTAALNGFKSTITSSICEVLSLRLGSLRAASSRAGDNIHPTFTAAPQREGCYKDFQRSDYVSHWISVLSFCAFTFCEFLSHWVLQKVSSFFLLCIWRLSSEERVLGRQSYRKMDVTGTVLGRLQASFFS